MTVTTTSLPLSGRQFLTGAPDCSPNVDGLEQWDFKSSVGFRDANDVEWWAVAPFTCDGASIPYPLRVIFGHPFRSDYIRPAALHDWYYANWAWQFSGPLAAKARLAVDKMFYAALLEDGVHPVKAYLFYWGVRRGGWVAWNNHAKKGRQAHESSTQ